MQKILILASNPRKDLNLDSEIRDLQAVIERSQNREQFEVISGLAVRVGDLHELMLKHSPQIVHFCGHGSGEQGLVFLGNDGGEQWVKAEALSEMFRLFSSNVGCVLLNACYSEEQANAIVNHIDYVIGMNQEIRDDAAIAFSKGFYRALGYNRPIEEAYEFGRNAIQLEISGSSKMRSAVTQVDRKLSVVDAVKNIEILEHNKPILKRKSSLANISIPTLSEDGRVAILLDIERSLEADPKLEQYRKRVKLYLADRKLTEVEQIRLNQLQNELGLAQSEADRILQEEQAPVYRSRQNYQNLLNVLIQRGLYPFEATVLDELKKCQKEENLTDGEVDEISIPIFNAVEIANQEKLKHQTHQEYEAKLKRYKQLFRRAVSAEYPIGFIRTGLRSFQQSLGLRDEDIVQIEKNLKQQPKEHEVDSQSEPRNSFSDIKLQQFEFDVITVDKDGNENSRVHKSVEYFTEDLGNQILLDMVKVPAGTFLMGSPEGQGNDSEQPQHFVALPSFFMGKYSITQSQWKSVAALSQVEIPLNPNPSKFKGDALPVEQVSWDEAMEFCQRLSRFTGHHYSLPSESEREYACRARTTTEFYFGETLTAKISRCADLIRSSVNMRNTRNMRIGQKLVLAGAIAGTIVAGVFTPVAVPVAAIASVTANLFIVKTTPVGSFLPNAFGLYDMHGNVYEWCKDSWHVSYKDKPAELYENGDQAWKLTQNDKHRVLRGGCWNDIPASCRSASRHYARCNVRSDNFSFRVVMRNM